MQVITGILTICYVIKELLVAGKYVLELVIQQRELQAKKALANEIRLAVKESVKDFDNSRLVKVFDPDSEPFPRRNVESKPDGVQ